MNQQYIGNAQCCHYDSVLIYTLFCCWNDTFWWDDKSPLQNWSPPLCWPELRKFLNGVVGQNCRLYTFSSQICHRIIGMWSSLVCVCVYPCVYWEEIIKYPGLNWVLERCVMMRLKYVLNMWTPYRCTVSMDLTKFENRFNFFLGAVGEGFS